MKRSYVTLLVLSSLALHSGCAQRPAFLTSNKTTTDSTSLASESVSGDSDRIDLASFLAGEKKTASLTSLAAESSKPAASSKPALQTSKVTWRDRIVDAWKSRGRPTSESDEEYHEAKKMLDQPEKTLLLYARWKEDVGDLASAYEKYATVLRQNPDSIDAMLGLARIAEKEDRIEDADEMFRTVLSENPRDSRVICAVARFYTEQGHPADAIGLLSPAINRNPDDRSLRSAMGTALVKAERIDEAIPHYTKCVGRASALYNVGYLLYEKGDTYRAEQYISAALERNPDLPEARRMMAAIRGDTGLQQTSGEVAAPPASRGFRTAPPRAQFEGF